MGPNHTYLYAVVQKQTAYKNRPLISMKIGRPEVFVISGLHCIMFPIMLRSVSGHVGFSSNFSSYHQIDLLNIIRSEAYDQFVKCPFWIATQILHESHLETRLEWFENPAQKFLDVQVHFWWSYVCPLVCYFHFSATDVQYGADCLDVW